jgi:hypothetical protein
MRLSKLQKLYPFGIGTKEFFLTLLDNFQMRRAITAAFTSEIRWMTIKKGLFRNGN